MLRQLRCANLLSSRVAPRSIRAFRHNSASVYNAFRTQKCVQPSVQSIYTPGVSNQRFFADTSYSRLKESIRYHQEEGEELAFAWISPRSLTKGLEGGILSRLLCKPELRLCGARMYRPSEDFLDEYIEVHKTTGQNFPPFVKFLESLRPRYDETRGYPSNMLLLLFTGPNCRSVISEAIGQELPNPRSRQLAKHIRGTYGFFRRSLEHSENDLDEYEFEPALVGSKSTQQCRLYMELFSKYADQDGGVLIQADQWSETGIVMLKPDALKHASSHVGHIMDLFSSTGLHLRGAKLFSFSVNSAEEFYGFLRGIFAKKLASKVESTLRQRLEHAFNFDISNTDIEIMTALLKQKHAEAEVNKIIHYMSGVYPHPGMTEKERSQRGDARCLALVYTGPNAIETIRNKLGATNPTSAAYGTIRSDYGHDLMRNAAHASDSFESLERERRIIGFHRTQGEQILDRNDPDYRPSDVGNIIDLWLEEVDAHPASPEEEAAVYADTFQTTDVDDSSNGHSA